MYISRLQIFSIRFTDNFKDVRLADDIKHKLAICSMSVKCNGINALNINLNILDLSNFFTEQV